MNQSQSFISMLLMVIAMLSTAPFGQVMAQQSEDKPLYVVVLKDVPGARDESRRLAAAHGAVHTYRAVFSGFAAPLNAAAREALAHNPNVELIEKAFEVHAINIDSSSNEVPNGVDRIDAEKAHAAGQTGLGARVAVIDTGIDFDHPDLSGQEDTTVPSLSFVSRGKTTDGGRDDHGHGTHVAGIVAAVSDGVGVVGVSPGAKLVSLKVLNKRGSGSSADIIAALDYITAVNQAASSYAEMIHVANGSFGGSGSDRDSSYRRAFDATVASGSLVVVAAGNESDDAANHVPAAYDSVFTVSAMNPADDRFASFSNYGGDVDMSAPGVAINSTVLGGGYASWNGTSMAAPHVAGSAALYVGSAIDSLTPSTAVNQIRIALLGSGESIQLVGDPDTIDESLADAEAVVGPIQPPADAIVALLNADKTVYAEADTTATLAVQVRDELGDPVLNLPPTAFMVDGAPVLASASESGGGDYAIVIDISAFILDTDYAVTVTVTDGLLSSIAGTVIRKASVQPLTIHVSAIEYSSSKRNLSVSLTVSDTSSVAVEGALISIALHHDSGASWSGSALTGSDGSVSFTLRSAPSGHYNTSVNEVSKEGASYDATSNIDDPGFDK